MVICPRFVLTGLTLTTLLGCLSKDAGRPVGNRCSGDNECRSGLHCQYGRCRQPCSFDRDCGTEGTCVPSLDDPTVYVCTLADEGGDGQCPEGLSDDGTGQCRRSCDSNDPDGATACGHGQECRQGWCRRLWVWVPIPGGTFDMGSTYDHNERPVHSVSVSSFEMLQTEVTVAQYGLCVTDGACSEPSGGGDCNWNDQITYRDHPVNCIEWQQAVDFCAWAGGRLPSEAEWEHAARSGGQPITYPWGDGEASCDYAVMKDPTLGEGCGTNHTWTVCSKEDGNTAQGLCDMGGNTWEWTQDSYHADYEGAPDNGSAWDDGGDTRVRRGGSFRNPASGLRTANRDSDIAIERVGVAIGLRCTR